jgi:hypothetical protein
MGEFNEARTINNATGRPKYQLRGDGEKTGSRRSFVARSIKASPLKGR